MWTILAKTHTKFWSWLTPPPNIILRIMKMEIIEIGSKVSEAGNCAVKMRAVVETTTVVGVNRQQVTYYLSTQADTVTVKVKDSIELDLADFTIVTRMYEYTDEDTGEVHNVPLKWLVPKPVK